MSQDRKNREGKSRRIDLKEWVSSNKLIILDQSWLINNILSPTSDKIYMGSNIDLK